MTDARIEIQNQQTAFAPGETISGTVAWDFPKIPKHVELRLFWYTSGKGTRDVEVVEQLSFPDLQVNDQRAFSFVAPAHPPSFSGKLVSVIWALELVSEILEQAPRIDLIIAPNRSEILLSQIAG